MTSKHTKQTFSFRKFKFGLAGLKKKKEDA